MIELINSYIKYTSLFLLRIALKMNSHQSCAFIIWLNTKKSKKIKSRSKNTKKILVFPKSGGYEDLVETFSKTNRNITFYLLPRIFLKEIFNHFFKQKNKRNIKDYYTKFKTLEEIKKKKDYINFLILTFKHINSSLRIDGCISFNIFYYAEKYFEEVCKNLNLKFIILHKESVFTPMEETTALKIYRENNDKSLAHKVSVYSENQKKILIKSGIVSKEKIFINGNPRCDYSFRLRKIKPKNKIIIYYLIESYRNKNVFINNKKNNWNKLYNQTLSYVLEFAKQNPSYKVILKGKTGIHKKSHFDSQKLPNNCSFIEGGLGQRLLKDASVVIAFNSTIVFEAILGNRNLVIPNFNNENFFRKKILHKIKDKKYFANNKKQFTEKINFYLKSKYKKNKKLSQNDHDTLKYYIGNVDGKSGIKVQKFINKIYN